MKFKISIQTNILWDVNHRWKQSKISFSIESIRKRRVKRVQFGAEGEGERELTVIWCSKSQNTTELQWNTKLRVLVQVCINSWHFSITSFCCRSSSRIRISLASARAARFAASLASAYKQIENIQSFKYILCVTVCILNVTTSSHNS